MNCNNAAINIVANEFSKPWVIIVAIIRATWFWFFFALVVYVNTEWKMSAITPIVLLIINTIIVLYKYLVRSKQYVHEIFLHDSGIVLIYCDFRNSIQSKEVSYQTLRFTYYNKGKVDFFYSKSPITLSIYDNDLLVEDIIDGEYGWHLQQLEQLYDEITVRTLPFTQNLKKEIPVKIKGSSKRRKQIPDSCPFCE